MTIQGAGQVAASTGAPASEVAARAATEGATEPVSLFDKRATFLVVVALLIASGAGIWRVTTLDLQQYEAVFKYLERTVTEGGSCVENLLLLQASLAPFRSFVIVRGSALFLSFSVVLIGSLFVLTGIKTAYRLNVEVPDRGKSMLEASSPGLLLIALGAGLMAATIYREASPKFTPVECGRELSPDARRRLRDALNPPLKDAQDHGQE